MCEDSVKPLFNKDNQYVLFSGTDLNGNGAFRHLNDLFFILYGLVKKNISKENVYLSIDFNILKNLDIKTLSKKISLDGKEWTFSEYIEAHIDKNNFIEPTEFEKKFSRKNNDLIFFASGHGAVQGLSIEGNNSFLSSDYFETIAGSNKSTYLIMSQCQAGAFHHLDTRKRICVIGASEYQNSISLPISSMTNNTDIITNFSFETNTAINPFIFSLFCVLIFGNNQNVIINKNKNLINAYKYVASSTISFVSQQAMRKRIIITKQDILSSTASQYEITVDNILIQQPFLLNKILAARTLVN